MSEEVHRLKKEWTMEFPQIKMTVDSYYKHRF